MEEKGLKLLFASACGENDAALMACFRSLAGFDVLPQVSTGQEILAYVRAGAVDVLLMDTVIWGLDALSVLSEMETEGLNKPILFTITGIADETVLSVFQSHGVIYCFAKPVSPEGVARQVAFLTKCVREEGERKFQRFTYTQEDMQRNEITRQIRAVGVPAHLKGYHYLRSAIGIMASSPEPVRVPVTKEVYPAVAREFGTKPDLVERAIRNAIEVAWTRGNAEVLDLFFGYTIDDKKGKPTNSEFIAMVADRVRMTFH